MDMEYGFDNNFYACKVEHIDKPQSCLNPPFQVSMEFTYKTDHHYVHIDSYTAEYDILYHSEENQHAIILFCLCVFREPSALCAVLSSLQIDPTEHRQIANKILACGNSILSSSNDDGQVVSLVVNITRTHILYWFDKENMVRANEQSIKEVSQKLVTVVGDEEEGDDHDHDVCSNSGRVEKSISENETCGVCLEKFSVGTYACEMPCSHKFHPNCIVTWLNISHYCPLCRYEMPTNSHNLLL